MEQAALSRKILLLLQEEAIIQFPLFPEAFGLLAMEEKSNMETALGTDGRCLFFDAEKVCALFKEQPEQLRWMYLHLHLHVILSDSHEFWACNLDYNEKNTIDPSAFRQLISADGYKGHSSAAKGSPHSHGEILRKIRETLSKEIASGTGKRGKAPGSSMEEAHLQKRDSMNYHAFLQRFTVPREEAILDNDSFDYIPYHYGLTYYGNLPFIEPLEYKEVNRLDEFAIAIDTSGSCSGPMVRRFLEETWSILNQRENFFAKMRLHLIQCDSMLQEHRIFTSVEEWEEAVPKLQILGQGNTDFRPVFEFLEKQISLGEIRNLRGLLYFTDGDGIFPREKPSFETAFVFLNRATEKHAIPDWGIRFNLNLPEDFQR